MNKLKQKPKNTDSLVISKHNGKPFSKRNIAQNYIPPIVTVIQSTQKTVKVKDIAPDAIVWAMKNPEKRAQIKLVYSRFNPLLTTPLSFRAFNKSANNCKLLTRLRELREGTRSTAKSSEAIGKSLVEDFIAERRRRGIEHVKKMFTAVDKIHGVFDHVNPTKDSLSSFTQQAKQINELGQSVFNLDKESVVAPNQLNIAVLINGSKEDDAIDV